MREIYGSVVGEVSCLGVQTPGFCPDGQGESRKDFKKRNDNLGR